MKHRYILLITNLLPFFFHVLVYTCFIQQPTFQLTDRSFVYTSVKISKHIWMYIIYMYMSWFVVYTHVHADAQVDIYVRMPIYFQIYLKFLRLPFVNSFYHLLPEYIFHFKYHFNACNIAQYYRYCHFCFVYHLFPYL